MYHLYPTSFFYRFQILLFIVILEKIQFGESSYDPLPLILINDAFRCSAPTRIGNIIRSENGKYFPTKTGFPSHSSVIGHVALCAARSEINKYLSNEEKIIPDDENCLYPIKFDTDEELKCTHEPEPFIRKLQNKIWIKSSRSHEHRDIPCGPDQKGRMYTFAYKVCITLYSIDRKKLDAVSFPYRIPYRITDKTEFEIYNFCYHDKEKQISHTEHVIRSPELLFDNILNQERDVTYEMTLDSRNYFGLSLDFLKKMYSTIEKDDSSYKLQKIVSPDDFAFALWRKPAYYILNIKKMRVDLIPLWDHIGKLIRKAALKKKANSRGFRIITGAYQIYEGQLRILSGKSQTPDIWFKKIILRTWESEEGIESAVLAIYMNQNFDNVNDLMGSPVIETCPKNLCEGAFTQQFANLGESIRCCSIDQDDNDIQRMNIKIIGRLDARFLYGRGDGDGGDDDDVEILFS